MKMKSHKNHKPCQMNSPKLTASLGEALTAATVEQCKEIGRHWRANCSQAVDDAARRKQERERLALEHKYALRAGHAPTGRVIKPLRVRVAPDPSADLDLRKSAK